MYIIEKIVSIINNLKNISKPVQKITFKEDTEELEDVVTCQHIFVPIDSTKNVLACSKCGYLITKERIDKSKNIFIKKDLQ